MTALKKIVNNLSIRAWITIFATSALGIEIWLVLSAVWDKIGFYGQCILVSTTFVVVLAFGYGKTVTPDGFLIRKRKKRRR